MFRRMWAAHRQNRLGGSHPALLLADKMSMWKEIFADRLEGALAAVLPICCACNTAKTLVREHPELVIDRHCADQRLGVEYRG